MTQEDRELLLKDLCARLPYRVIVQDRNGTHILTLGNTEIGTEYIKPYLRPISSMTEEELKQFCEPAIEMELESLSSDEEGPTIKSMAADAYQIDYLNKHHFDYRGLIEKGLAHEAPEGMYE